ncbi:sulfatase modifying factor 1 [Pedobacter sp. CG_S7]|uniref:type IX secretion system lipoprotein PorK/GldK n=1 Tax=Pedobacter sp. CG_S7 TaxID=3143930 RepID=UPI003392F650
MRKSYLRGFIATAIFLSSIITVSHAQSRWVRVKKNKVYSPHNRDMASIPAGQTFIGLPVEIMDTLRAPGRMVSISAFFMDRTEISNEQYREFVHWVRDSVAITMLGPTVAPNLFKPVSTTKGGATLTSQRQINWKNRKLLWRNGSKGYADKLANMYYTGDDALLGKKEIDIRKIRYSFIFINMDLAAAGRNDPNKNRRDFIQSYVDNPDPSKANEFPSIKVYPDTLAWKVDYGYSENDPMVKDYFNNPAFNDFPVVGVTWEQANAYCMWLTRKYAGNRGSRKQPKLEFRLPTVAEFEYAAKAGEQDAKYPWDGDLLNGDKGHLLANFKNDAGIYTPDYGLFPVNVRSYSPNNFGLYNMSGNVSEWTATAYNPSSVGLLNDFNPNFTYAAKPTDSKYLKRKVVKGGSWKDIAYFLQNSVSTYEFQDQPRSYIGFRCVASYPGTNIK